MYIENMVNTWYIKTTNLIHFYAGWSRTCYWKAIKHPMNNYKSPDSIPILKRSANGNEELCYEDVDKAYCVFFSFSWAYCLKYFFTSVSTVDDSNNNLPLFQPVTDSFIDNVHILRTDIEDIISTLDTNKAFVLT